MFSSIRIFLIRLALVAFIVTKAIVPIGFMPNAIATGTPFVLCSGHAHNQFWLAPPDQQSPVSQNHQDHRQHGGHAHGEHREVNFLAPASHHASPTDVDDQCQFSLLAFTAAVNWVFVVFLVPNIVDKPKYWAIREHSLSAPYHLPLPRAPPKPLATV